MGGAGGATLTATERTAAVTAFEKLGLCEQLCEAAAGLGWKGPSSIQEQAIPHLLAGMQPCAVRLMRRFCCLDTCTEVLGVTTTQSCL
jgi:superfamily II DNA/RNA helicase